MYHNCRTLVSIGETLFQRIVHHYVIDDEAVWFERADRILYPTMLTFGALGRERSQ